MNDVDPLSMTLGEIYGHPETSFEEKGTSEMYPYGMSRVVYGGSALRINGKIFFNIKDDIYTSYEMEDGTIVHSSELCGICDPFDTEVGISSMLSLDAKDSMRAHP